MAKREVIQRNAFNYSNGQVLNLYRHTLSFLSPAGRDGRLSIFIFHRVLPNPDPLFPDEPDAKRFNELMAWIASWFNVLPLEQAIDQLAQQSLPERAAAITFDDGYADNYSVALPILKKHGLQATFFIATGFLNGGRMWNDTIIESIRRSPLAKLDCSSIKLGIYPLNSLAEKREAIRLLIQKVKYHPIQKRLELTNNIADLAQAKPPSDLMMTTEEVIQLRKAGMQIGAHTVSHPILAKIDLSDARLEIQESKRFLEEILGERIRLFAYPNGKPNIDYLKDHVALIKDLGFDGAVTTAIGSTNLDGIDFFQLPRFTPWEKRKFRFWFSLLKNLLRSRIQ